MTDSTAQELEDGLVKSLGGMNGHGPGYVATPEADAELSTAVHERFSFDGPFQSKVASMCMRDNGFVRQIEGLVRPEFFENAYEASLVAMALGHFAKYKQIPSDVATWREILKDAIKIGRIRKDAKEETLDAFKRLMKTPINDTKFAVEKISDFARHQAILLAYSASIDLVEKGKLDEVQKIFTKAFQTAAVAEFRELDFWEDIERRSDLRTQRKLGTIKPQGIPTGIKQFDDLLMHKGWGRKELSVLMGGAKKGKSMGLGDFAIRASLQGYNALYVTLEVSDEIISERADANITGIAMREISNHIVEVRDKIKAASSRAGKLKIIEFPTGGLTPAGLRRICDHYRSQGIKFDLIVVDYADIMRPDVRTHVAIEDSKEVWTELRAIASEEDAAVLTATQTNRDGFKASTAKADNVADDFNKIRIADLVISINRSDEERDKGEARLYFAASRNQGGEFCLRIKQNMESMQFITAILGIE